MSLPNLGDLTSLVILAAAAIVALRLLYLTALGFLRPSLYIEAIKGPDGKEEAPGLADVIESELLALREEGGGPSLQLVTSMDAAVDIGPIEAETGRLKELSALLKLLPGRTRRVTGQLLPASAMGEGIAITITTTTNRVAATTSLWAAQYVQPADLTPDVLKAPGDEEAAAKEARICLSLAAAAWVAYRALDGSTGAARAGLLTQDWESYALFRVGARMQQLGLPTTARRLYLDALARDPRNRGALFNLAILDFLEQDEPAAVARLAQVVAEIGRNPLGQDDPWRFDRLWYRAQYNIAAAEWNAAARDGRPSPAVRQRVRQHVGELVDAADAAIEWLGGEVTIATGGRYADLARFLVDVRSAAIVIYADAARAA